MEFPLGRVDTEERRLLREESFDSKTAGREGGTTRGGRTRASEPFRGRVGRGPEGGGRGGGSIDTRGFVDELAELCMPDEDSTELVC